MKKSPQQLKQARMNLKRLRNDILCQYKQMVKGLVLEHREINSDSIRLEVMNVIVNHVATRSKARLARKVRDRTVEVPIFVDRTKELEPDILDF